MASPIQLADSKALSPNITTSTSSTLQSPPTSSSLAASRPRRSSSNNNNTSTTLTSATRSSSMNRREHPHRSRGYSNTSSTSYSPYSSSPSSTSPYPLPSSSYNNNNSDERRQQSKFERLFGGSNGSPSSSTNGNLYATSPSTSSNTALSSTPPAAAAAAPHSLRSSGIALTRRAAAAAQQRGTSNNGNNGGNSSGHADIVHTSSSAKQEDDNQEDDNEDEGEEGIIEYSSSPGGTRIGTITPANSLGLGGLHGSNTKKGSNNVTASSSSSSNKKEEKLLRCERCHKVYHHPQSLIKHRWQHTEIWSDASRYGLSKHATVQALEAAVILANPDTLRLLPNDKSHWPAAVSPPTSGLLGSERVNIDVLRKQAEVNERELVEQEKAGYLRAGPPSSSSSRRGASSMQTYSKSMPAQVGRRRSGLAFSLHNDMMDDDDDEDDEDDEDDIDIKDDATMATETNDERGEDGDEDDNDDDSTESEDENVIAGNTIGGVVKNGKRNNTIEMESMDQDMFSLDISSSSPYARASPLPPVAENGSTFHFTTTSSSSSGVTNPSARSGLSYSRKNYTTSLVAPLAERYTFLPTIPSSSSLHISDGIATTNMTAIPSTSLRTRNRSSSHTRSTRGFGAGEGINEYQEARGTRETSTSSSTDESGVSASASVGAGTTGGSGDEAISYATKDSGYISVAAQDSTKSNAPQQQHAPHEPASTAYAAAGGGGYTAATPSRPAIDPAQTATISMSAPVLGFFTERSPVSSFSNSRGSGAPTSRQTAGHASPRFGPVDAHHHHLQSPIKGEAGDTSTGFASGHNGTTGTTTAQAIPGYTPLEAQAAEILSSSHQSQSGPRSFSQTHFGASYTRSPGYHPYRPTSPFPSSRQLPSSSLTQAHAQAQQSSLHSSSPSAATGQAYSFGQAPLGTSYRSTSFNIASPASGQPKQFPMSPLARPADTIEGANDDDDDEMMDMDL